MTEITKYVADDGTEFDDEWDCKHYEWQQTFGNGVKFQMLDYAQDKLDPTSTQSYEDACFLFFPDHEAVLQCQEVWDCDMVDVYAPGFLTRRHTAVDCGLWVYDDTTEDWYHLGQRIDELHKLADTCMSVINGGV